MAVRSADRGTCLNQLALPSRRGFSFAARCAFIARMDPDLENVIRQALGVAKAAGRDDMGQNMLAVQAAQQARPDMTAADVAPVSSESQIDLLLETKAPNDARLDRSLGEKGGQRVQKYSGSS